VATLYVRNVPAELYRDLQQWAEADGRSLNAEVIGLLEREAERRRTSGRWTDAIRALRERYPREPGPPWASDLIAEERDRGWKPDQGY
jgi:hypothetical protein